MISMWAVKFYVRFGKVKIMSRIGKLPILFDSAIQVQVEAGGEVCLKKGEKILKIPVRPEIEVQINDQKIVLKRKNDEKKTRAFHGLYRALIYNAVQGLTQEWSKSLQFNGVGYRAVVKGQQLEMNLGYSHPILFDIPQGITIKVEKQTKVHISGANRQQVGQTAAQIRSFRPPEPYLAKGVKYMDEVIRKKAGKSGAEKK